MIRKLLVSMGVVLGLTGCATLSPQYTQPPAPVPAEWPQGKAYDTPQGTPGAPTAPDLAWRDFISDELLGKIIEIALNNNRDLRLATLNIDRARALYGVQRAELLPSVNATAGGSKQQTSFDLTSAGKERITGQYGVNLGISSWEIDFFGRIRSLEEQALEAYLATEQAGSSARIALISGVSTAYFTLAADKENLKLAKETLVAQQTTYDLIHRQYEVGVVGKLDLRRAETQLDTARSDIARYTQIVAQDHNALNLLAGSTVPDALLPQDLTQVKPLQDLSPALPSEALLRRPDIMAAEHQLKAAYAFIGAARAAFFPRISLTTTVGTASSELSGLFGGGNGTWSFAPQAVLPIFDARIWAAWRVSKAEQEIALTQYEKAIQTAFKEVADALAVKGTVDDQLQTQQSLVDAASEMHSLAMARYTKGVDSYLSVLDAQRSLYGTKQGLTALRLAKFTNQVRLYAVLGGGEQKTPRRHHE